MMSIHSCTVGFVFVLRSKRHPSIEWKQAFVIKGFRIPSLLSSSGQRGHGLYDQVPG